MAPFPKKNLKQGKKIFYMTNGCQIILNSPLSLTKSPPKSSTISSETSNYDFTIYENRLRTFNDDWKLEFITPEKMATAGFCYSGEKDRVRCTYCSKEFDNWQHGDDPQIEHRKYSPHCPFFKTSKGYDVCGCYDIPTYQNPNETKEIQQFLDSMGVLQQIKLPRNKDFVTFEARLKTFDKCMKQLKQSIHTLCEAGLYYTGDGQNDLMICFYCNQGLRDWEDNDDPWAEHALWSSNCSYLLLSKGKQFVDKVCSMKNNGSSKINQEVIADHNDASVPENNEKKVNLTQRKLHQAEATNKLIKPTSPSSENLSLSQQQDISTLSDSMLCKICYKDKMKVAFIPCGHVIACIQCAMTLDQCAVCRNPYNMAMSVYIYRDQDKKDDQLQCGPSQASDNPPESMLCKVCHKEEMEAAFIPCRHVYACIQCATELQECPVCFEEICATMQVYL